MSFPPLMVDRSLVQMHKAGFIYAAVPLPVLTEWVMWATRNGTRFVAIEGLCCWPDLSGEPTINDDGDVLLCLLPVNHDGPCPFDAVGGLACRSPS